MSDQPIDPGKLVVKLGPRFWIAVRKIEACIENAINRSFQIPTLRVEDMEVLE